MRAARLRVRLVRCAAWFDSALDVRKWIRHWFALSMILRESFEFAMHTVMFDALQLQVLFVPRLQRRPN